MPTREAVGRKMKPSGNRQTLGGRLDYDANLVML